jgi:nitrite reductase/ring-hydroxylating ferredoxin subunit
MRRFDVKLFGAALANLIATRDGLRYLERELRCLLGPGRFTGTPADHGTAPGLMVASWWSISLKWKETAMIPNQWYAISHPRDVTRKKPLALKRMGEPLVLFRDSTGRVVCLRDRCPHKGAQLSLGKVMPDGTVACAYHGFRYDSQGDCTHVPCIGNAARIPKGLCAKAYRVVEKYDAIWLWWGDERPEEELPDIPIFDQWRNDTGDAAGGYDVPVHYTRYVESLSEFYHVPHVHQRHWFHYLINFWNPRGQYVQDYKCEVNGLHVKSSFVLRHDDDPYPPPWWYQFTPGKRNWLWNVELMMPNMIHLSAYPFEGLSIMTPIDDENTWVFFRARWLFQFPLLPRVLAKAASRALMYGEVKYNIHLEQLLDVRIMRGQTPKVSEIGASCFVAPDSLDSHFLRLRDKLKREAAGALSGAGSRPMKDGGEQRTAELAAE